MTDLLSALQKNAITGNVGNLKFSSTTTTTTTTEEDIYTDELNHNPIIAKWISTSKRILKIREFVINQSWQEVEKMCVQIENEEYQNLPCVGKESEECQKFCK